MSGLDFTGGRYPRTDEERFAFGYLAGHADAACGRLPTWQTVGNPPAKVAKLVPFYFAGEQAGNTDAKNQVHDVRAAWCRWQIEQLMKVKQ